MARLKAGWLSMWRLLLFLSVSFFLSSPAGSSSSRVVVPMPSTDLRNVRANNYMCTSAQGPSHDSYIVQYEPLADPRAVHHMLLFGCKRPPTQGSWDCKSNGQICGFGDGAKTIFAWALNASGLHMPPDVGLRVGPLVGINYFVVQIHYGHVQDIPDLSTVSRQALGLEISQTSPRYVAGIYLLGSGGSVTPGKDEAYVDSACKFHGTKSIHPFAFRTHAHGLGKQIVGYQVKSSGSWHVIGTRSPQDPQAFYPVTDKRIEVFPGDWLAVRCVFNTASTQHAVRMGPNTEDEMCNFYIMYYTRNDNKALGEDSCWRAAPPFLHYPRILPPLPHDGVTPLEEEEHHHHSHSPQGAPHMAPPSDTPSEIPPTSPISPTTHPTQPSIVSTTASPPLLTPKVPPPPPPPLPPPTQQPEVGVSPPLGTLFLAEDWPLNGYPIPQVTLGQLTAVAVDPQGDLHVLHRGPVVWDITSFDQNHDYQHVKDGPIEIPVLLKFSASTGKPSEAWGAKFFYMPHGLTVDHEGSFWVTDVALHQVFKFDSLGDKEPSLSLGTRFRHGSGLDTFCQPSSVAVEKSGTFYVADGYCNHRILKYTPAGKVEEVWQAPIAGKQLFIPHKAILNAANDILYVADRQNSRIIAFNTKGGRGRVLSEGGNLGGFPYSIAFNNTEMDWPMLGVFGGVASGGKLTGFSLDKEGHKIATWGPKEGFGNPHDLTVDTVHNAVYVTEIGPNKLWKFVPFPSLPPLLELPPPPATTTDHPSSLGKDLDEALPDYHDDLTPVTPTTDTSLETVSGSGEESNASISEEVADASAQDSAHLHSEDDSKKPTVGVNVGVTVAVLAIIALIVLVTVGVLKEHRLIRFQGWRLLQAGERDTTVGVKASDGTTTMREVEKKKKRKKKRTLSPRRKLQSLLGPSRLGFSRLRTYDSNSEDEEFPVFNRV